MWAGYLDRRGFVLRAGIAFALVLGFPYLFSLGWLQFRNSLSHDTRGVVQLLLFVVLKSGITIAFAIYMSGVLARRLRYLGANPWFAALMSGLYASDTIKYMTFGFQAYLMPGFLAPQWGLIALGMMAALMFFKDAQDAALENGPSPPLPELPQPSTRPPSAPSSHQRATFGRRS
jgi:hypothetical protein